MSRAARGTNPGGSLGPNGAERHEPRARLAAALAEAEALGTEIATTPKDTIWRDGKATLARYCPLVDAKPLGPMLILQGLFGRQTITDLEPERSLVRRLLGGGVDLYVLDWGEPSRADLFMDFTDYAIDGLGDAIDAMAEASGGRRAALLGICQGGVFALCQAALCPERVAGLALAVTPVDFHADRQDPDPAHGFLNLWMRNLPATLLDEAIDSFGNLPGSLTGAVFQQLTPMRTAAKYSTELADLAKDPAGLATFLRMETWLADRPDLPGAAAKQWLIELYHENRLAAGRFALDGRPVDLGQVRCPILNIVARHDHIIPPPCSRALEHLTASQDYRLLEVPTGHIGVFVSQKARDLVAPGLIDWLSGLDQRPAPA